MDCPNFIQTTVTSLDTELFSKLRDDLIINFLQLQIAQKDDQTVPVFAEKLCDHFEKVQLKTSGSFDRIVDKYANDLNSVVADRIAKEQKNEPTPRARKYYDYASSLRKSVKESEATLLDYTRIMLCLYAEIIENDFTPIKSFNLSIGKLDLVTIVEALINEKTNLVKKPKFDVEDPYASDRCTFIMLVIMFYYMKSREVFGEC